MEILRRVKDWWRGWAVADLDSVRAKLDGPEARRPDGIIGVTEREMNALRDFPLRPAPVRDPLDELCWEYEPIGYGPKPPIAELVERLRQGWNLGCRPGPDPRHWHWARRKYAHATWD